MIGCEFNGGKHVIPKSNNLNALPKNIGARVQKKCLDKGLMLLTTSAFVSSIWQTH